MKRERWGSKLGVILAVAGSAVGLGNFLRFPVQAVKNGGGAFMIPYFISLFLLGIPLMWIEWTIGRFGGGFGHGTAPGIFHTLWNKNRFIKYFGVIGIFGPIVIFIYYTYIESWLLAYVFFPLRSDFSLISTKDEMVAFLQGYQGIVKNQYFSSILPAYFFFLITFFLNVFIVYYGIK
jgi:NSS family neurotransmitter:Na+ symporter